MSLLRPHPICRPTRRKHSRRRSIKAPAKKSSWRNPLASDAEAQLHRSDSVIGNSAMRGEILPLKTIREAAFSTRSSESKAISFYVCAFCSTKMRVAARIPAAATVVVFIPYKIRRSFQPRYETEILSLGPNLVITAMFLHSPFFSCAPTMR